MAGKKDARGGALASERYADYKRGWLAGSNSGTFAMPLEPNMAFGGQVPHILYESTLEGVKERRFFTETRHPDWYQRGVEDGKAAFGKSVKRLSKELGFGSRADAVASTRRADDSATTVTKGVRRW